MSITSRFWSKVDRNGPVVRPELGPCWLWTGMADRHGYGLLRRDRGEEGGRYHLVHRLSYELHHGPIPPGKEACHHCDVRSCVRPTHLFSGNHDANMKDMAQKGRQAKGPEHSTANHSGRLQSNNRSGLKGVSWDNARGLWASCIQPAGQRQAYLGRYVSAINAGLAYDRAARRHYGAGAYQNFRVDPIVEEVLLSSFPCHVPPERGITGGGAIYCG